MSQAKREYNFNPLYRKAAAQGAEEKAAEEMGRFAVLLRDHYALKLFLEDQRINAEYKKKKLALIFPASTSCFFLDLLNGLIDCGQVSRIPNLATGFSKKLLQEKGIMAGEVESGAEISPAKREKLRSLMDKMTGKKTILRYGVKPQVLGGICVRFIDGTIWDASLKSKLHQLYLAAAR
jgi:F-type H+-transporting ATPase subunit delta